MQEKIIIFFIIFLPLDSLAQFNTITRENYLETKCLNFIGEDKNIIVDNINNNNGINIEYNNNLSPHIDITELDLNHDSLCYSLPLNEIVVNSEYGTRRDPFSGKKKAHYGLDLKADNSPVFSMLPGRVKKVGYDKRAGIYITIENPVCSYSYCHLSKINVLENNYVRAGQLIGLSGNTGRSTGPHLHITCRWSDNNKLFNPLILINFIKQKKKK